LKVLNIGNVFCVGSDNAASPKLGVSLAMGALQGFTAGVWI
jgi:hypothetical protein